MLGLPFFNKNKQESEGYTFLLFLAGEKVHAFAIEDKDPHKTSTLYTEHIDPFLHDASLKIEMIIGNCEREFAPREVYLKKTVLFLNSLYTTESGGIREDFRKSIKKLLKDVDLDNLGYVNFYEAVNYFYGKKYPHYALVEESVYDYTVYLFKNAELTKTHKIAKTQQDHTDKEEIKKYLKDHENIIGFHYQKTPKVTPHEVVSIETEGLVNLLAQVYLKQETLQSAPSAVVIEEEQEDEKPPVHTAVVAIDEDVDIRPDDVDDLPEAPGFIIQHDYGTSTMDVIENPTEPEMETMLPSVEMNSTHHLPIEEKVKNKGFGLPKIGNFRFFVPLAMGVGIILLVVAYFALFHRAKVSLVTRKENFSTTIDFTVGKNKELGEAFSYQFSTKLTRQTTGEEQVGEKAEGEVTIYNGLFEKKDLGASTQLHTKSGVVFVLAESVSVPAATTSANLGAGVVTKAFGKKTVKVKALAIGAEANIDDGTKLVFDNFKEEDVYALATKNFTGGFKKTVQVFSEEDQEKLEEMSLKQVAKELQTSFKISHSADDFLFLETLTVTDEKKRYSEKVDTEADEASLSHTGTATVYYIPHSILLTKVQNEKLKDKEFVKDTFELKKTKLEKAKKNEYVYSAQVNGKVQRLIDEKHLAQELAGRLVKQAGETLSNERTVQSYVITFQPIPVPIMPFNPDNIAFEFARQ